MNLYPSTTISDLPEGKVLRYHSDRCRASEEELEHDRLQDMPEELSIDDLADIEYDAWRDKQ